MEHFAISSLSPDIECETLTTYECEITGNKRNRIATWTAGAVYKLIPWFLTYESRPFETISYTTGWRNVLLPALQSSWNWHLVCLFPANHPWQLSYNINPRKGSPPFCEQDMDKLVSLWVHNLSQQHPPGFEPRRNKWQRLCLLQEADRWLPDTAVWGCILI